MDSYSRELDAILEEFEVAAKNENVYLLHTAYTLDLYVIGCGLSPACSFSPAIILTQQQHTIFFGIFEWNTFIDLIKLRSEDFFQDPAVSASPITYQCGDFGMLTQLKRDDGVKTLELLKYNVAFYLYEEDLLRIIDINSRLIERRLAVLEERNFCAYYYNVIDIIKTHYTNKNRVSASNLDILKLLQLCLDLCFSAMLVVCAFKEYMYFYEDNVLNDINK